MLESMTTALQLPGFDHTMNRANGVDWLAGWLAIARARAGQAILVGRVLSASARFVSRLGRFDPYSFKTTDDVWAAVDHVERVFFTLIATASKIPASDSQPRHVAEVFGDDIAARLTYTRSLMRQSAGAGTRRLHPSESRRREQDILDDRSVPPEVRVVIHESRGLPVLLAMGYMLDSPTFKSDEVRALIRQTIRECLDHMIALLLATIERRGLHPLPPPDDLLGSLPDPMPLDDLEENWRGVQAEWANC